jgi:ribosomal protein S18 acetylase RimI-like enzyme
MQAPEIVTATEENRDRVIQSLLLGFSADPLVRWFWPEASTYLKSGAAYDAFAGGAIAAGSAFITTAYEGIAMWCPPGVDPDEERMIPHLQETVATDIIDEAFGVFGAMEEYHPEEPCWYLPMISVDPAYQGRGIGSQLMKHALRRIDEDGLPAYLESSNPQNMSLYERHGFEVMGQIQVGSSPLIHPMIRAARQD